MELICGSRLSNVFVSDWSIPTNDVYSGEANGQIPSSPEKFTHKLARTLSSSKVQKYNKYIESPGFKEIHKKIRLTVGWFIAADRASVAAYDDTRFKLLLNNKLPLKIAQLFSHFLARISLISSAWRDRGNLKKMCPWSICRKLGSFHCLLFAKELFSYYSLAWPPSATETLKNSFW
jgi:hypothetical protein